MNQHTIFDTTAYRLVQLCKTYRCVAGKQLATLNLHVGQDIILLHLASAEGCTQSELAEQLAVRAATITKMVSRMAEAGLLERHSDPDDQRVSRIYLTEQGRDLQPAIKHMWQQLDSLLCEDLTMAERLLLQRLLAQLHTNLQTVNFETDS